MDSMQRLAASLRDDLHGHATVTVDARSTGNGTIVIAPSATDAMRLTVSGGRDEILCVEFGEVAAVECLGNRRSLAGKAILPAEELGLLLRAVVTGGAELCTAPLRGRLLVVGGEPAADQMIDRLTDRLIERRIGRRSRVLQRWAPIAPALGTMTTILRPLENDSPPPGLFVIPAFRITAARLKAHAASAP